MRDDPLFIIYTHGFDRMGELTSRMDVGDEDLFLLGEPAAELSDRDDYSDLNMKEDEEGFFGGYPVEEYAHTLVMNALYGSEHSGIGANSSTTQDGLSAIEGVLPVEDLVLISMVWMSVAHELHEVLRFCKDEYNSTKSLAALDRAVALWIGGAENDGGMLYRLTEVAGSGFRRLDPDGDKEEKQWVNRELIEGWNDVQRSLLESQGTCSGDDPFIATLRDDIYRSINQMTIPLVQNLILSVVDKDNRRAESSSTRNSVDTYYSVVMPQVMACDLNLARELYSIHSTHTINETDKKAWIDTLETTYSCLRLSCRDVGTVLDDYQNCQKVNLSTTNALAGYAGTSPVTRAISLIDRDVYQLSLFLKHGSFVAAKEWYSYGYNSVHSLRKVALGGAIPNNGTWIPAQLGLYQSYYGSPDFADIEINRALNFVGEFKTASHETIEAVVMGLVRYEVMYLSVASAHSRIRIGKRILGCRCCALCGIDGGRWTRRSQRRPTSLRGVQGAVPPF
jgi:hypothetical protein